MSKSHSEKDKLRLVSGWAESRESRAAYARRHGESVGSLAKWGANSLKLNRRLAPPAATGLGS